MSDRASTVFKEHRIEEIFLAGPFFQLVNPETGLMADAEQQRILTMIEHFESRGVKVNNAHRREAFGAQFLTAPECTKLDFTEIRRSDVFLGFPGSPASPGTHVEIGWASGLGKPMVLFLEKDKQYTFLVTGLETIANIRFVHFSDTEQLLEELPDALTHVMKAHAQVAG